MMEQWIAMSLKRESHHKASYYQASLWMLVPKNLLRHLMLENCHKVGHLQANL